MGCEVNRYTFCERERVDMENGKNQMDKNVYKTSNSSKWMEIYLKTMGVKKEETTENECERKFRMGENVYLSNREII